MRFFPVYFALVLLLIAVPGCTEAVEEDIEIEKATQEESAIEALTEMAAQWDAAANAGDVDALAAMLTDDYLRMNPDEPTVEGKEAVVADIKAFREENDVRDVKSELVEVRVAGDWAYVRGQWTSVVTPKATGEPINISGKWVDICELQPDGSWKLARTISNLDAPLPVTEE
jgi:uncharacterized protein (TIGR02246 family)